ncbi:threonine synthase [Candidatus Macondimonas diazotrophica]|jgi:threonine synthase|uniref:Threonine synthase n=1 Tax=Candidatus Macondimonas diazotrophica TaxID=2305248 RepID=A0A4Z0F751_9GAMM|nr:threonine synthase [Candidatus Macondimonas diazotrophica]NCU00150.1 threonine synthase [Candidatus Macondimonas diazotrophica]TFZ81807.1 threonine synthase [Candidatus Macondimonas diazotrophica]
MTTASLYTGLIDKYRDRLPLPADAPAVSLCEGQTPLIRLANIERDLGGDLAIYAKFEGLNPTGSFKDRGMTVAVTQAVAEGSRAIICASTGNTSASAAAYAARAGLTAFVLIPEGKIALGKLAQAMAHGAVVLQIQGNFDDGMRLVREVAAEAPITIVNSINPFRLQGQKTAAFEIVEALGRAPDYHCLPVGNAGNITAYWIGYSELATAGGETTTIGCSHCAGQCPYPREPVITARPRMLGYQATGAAPFLKGGPVEHPETVATAIRIGNPQSWSGALAAQQESGGWFAAFTDDEIVETQKYLARREGVFCEPASAVSLAGALTDIRAGRIARGSTIVCTLTGHGLKDPDLAIARMQGPVVRVAAERLAVEQALLPHLS